jgi:3-dehydroquinate synthase
MADSALGGKTAVNLPGGKNLVGAFHQPSGVYADPGTLITLPERHYRDGFAEIIKTAVVADSALFGRLEREVERLRSREGRALSAVLARCLRLKAGIVRLDGRDLGLRAVLNFGHTLGHALEVATGYRLTHGRAVALGLALEARIAHRFVGFPQSDVVRLDALLKAFGFGGRWPARLDPASVIAASRRDKKARQGVVRFVLPQRIGRISEVPDPTLPVPRALVREVLEQAVRRR